MFSFAPAIILECSDCSELIGARTVFMECRHHKLQISPLWDYLRSSSS